MNSKIQFLINHFNNMISLPFSFSNTLSEVINHYYKSNKQLGSKDRKILSELAFTYYRYKNILSLNDKFKENKDFEFFFIICFEVLSKSDTFQYILNEWDDYFYKMDENEKSNLLSSIKSLKIDKIVFSNLKETFTFNNQVDFKKLYIKSPITIRTAYQTDELNNIKSILKTNGIEFDENSQLGSLDIYSFKNIDNLMQTNDIKIEVQDNASLVISKYIAELTNENKYHYLLDACAGSGGKTLCVKFYGSKSKIDLYDNNPHRLNEFNNRNNKYDDLNLVKSKDELKKYDLIFIDAPCTGSGTFRRHPDKLHTIDEKIISNYVNIQLEVINTYSKLLNENGVLIYITCSMFNEENIDVINKFLQKNPLFEPDTISNSIITENSIKITNFAYQLIPKNYNGDIFFISQLKMKESK